MLFRFGTFWKSLLIVLSSWCMYGFFGYEITITTLLAVLVCLNLKDTHHLI